MSSWNRRRWLVALGLAALAAAGVRAAALQGWIAEIRIASGSMAETVLGPHQNVVCADCGMTFRCGVDSLPLTDLVVCPNCGYQGNTLPDKPFESGERVYVDRWPFWVGSPHRWDLVAFRDATQGDARTVKRIVGLPGETMAIRNGEIYVDGRLAAKPWSTIRQMATLVHDSHWVPHNIRQDLPARWRADDDATGWASDGTGFRYSKDRSAPDASASDRLDWLTYHHWPCVLSTLPRSRASAVLDRDAYHQGEPRSLHVVHDLLIVAELVATGPGSFAMRVNAYGSRWEVTLSVAQGNGVLDRDGKRVATFEVGRGTSTEGAIWILAAVDGQIWLVSRDRVLVRHAVPAADLVRAEASGADNPGPTPVAIGCAGGELRVPSLRVFRDVHYLGPGGGERPWTARQPLPRNHFFVLGDNPLISDDSRNWASGGVPIDRIVGKVIVPRTARPLDSHPTPIQLP